MASGRRCSAGPEQQLRRQPCPGQPPSPRQRSALGLSRGLGPPRQRWGRGPEAAPACRRSGRRATGPPTPRQ
eukprot:10321507-Alexandrium_andersonii.AAC.1